MFLALADDVGFMQDGSPPSQNRKHKRSDMGRKRMSSLDLIWIFHERLKEYDDHPFHGVALAVIPTGNGDWTVAMPRKLPKREPDIGTRVGEIEKQLKKQYSLLAE